MEVRLVNHLEATPRADAVEDEAGVKRQTVFRKHFSHQLHLRLRERPPALPQPISDDLLAQLGSEGGDFEEERLRAVGAESVEDVVLVRQSRHDYSHLNSKQQLLVRPRINNVRTLSQ